MKISQKGINFIKNEEQFRSKPYLDSVGVPTIGFGSTVYMNGKAVTMKDKPITEAEATELLNHKLQSRYIPAVKSGLNVNVTQNQFDALTSFIYNVGPGGTSSTLFKKINAGIKDPDTIKYWFGVWNKGTVNGKKVELKGLTNRRAREANLFLS